MTDNRWYGYLTAGINEPKLRYSYLTAELYKNQLKTSVTLV